MAAKPRPYIDFKLYLTRLPDEKTACQVALLPTPEVGETIAPVTVPLEEIPPSDVLQWLAAKKATFGSMVALGKKLANCLLPEGIIRERFRTAYDRAGIDGGVRLRLIIADYALKAWPWEYAFFDFLGGPESKSMLGFLALNPRISLVRHEPLPHPHPTREKTTEDVTDIRMAFASALPKEQPKLQLDKDLAVIQEALGGFNVEGVRITLDPVLTDATPDDLAQKLPKGTHIFHFAGHGIPESDTAAAGPHREGALLLVADKKSKAEAKLHASDLAAIVQDAGVRLVVLGACSSGERQERSPWEGVAAALAAREIPAIIAMQYEVIDVSAKAFSRAFYGALASGLSLDEAMSTGRRAMLRETSTNPDLKYVVDVEWGVPVLYSRLPDGQLFPERMQRAGQAAEEFRKVITQTVTDIQKGVLTGIDVKIVKSGVKVVQTIKTATGHTTGIKAGTAVNGANIQVEQEIDTAGKDSVTVGYQGDEI
jgi:hypothetical protein